MKTVAVIGAGRIGGPVIHWIRRSAAYRLGAVLTRSGDPVAALSGPIDLVLELAGPEALRAHGPRALALCDVWTVSGAALADPELHANLSEIGLRAKHRLRVLGGAVAGLDGIAAAAQADASVALHVQRPGLAAAEGSVAALALAHPQETSFAVAAALAAPGPGAVRLRLGDGPAHRIAVTADCGFGRIETTMDFAPRNPAALHPVAAAVIAALWRETQVIQAG